MKRGTTAALVLLLASCSAGPQSPRGSRAVETLRVLAASSLTESFGEIARAYEKDHPEVRIETSFGGSSSLAAQIRQGAPADLFAAADSSTMQSVAADLDGAPAVFARNSLAIAVEPGNPRHVSSLASLNGLTVVLCDPSVPCGALSATVLRRAGITIHAASLEPNVKGAVTKVATGNADAALVYVTDIAAAHGSVQGVSIPPAQNAITRYPIAVLRSSAHKSAARAFLAYVLDAGGQSILRRAGFLAP